MPHKNYRRKNPVAKELFTSKYRQRISKRKAELIKPITPKELNEELKELIYDNSKTDTME